MVGTMRLWQNIGGDLSRRVFVRSEIARELP